MNNLSNQYISGEPSKREIRDINGATMRCARIRAARRHHRAETQNDHDSVRLPHGARLHPQYGRARQQAVSDSDLGRHLVGVFGDV